MIKSSVIEMCFGNTYEDKIDYRYKIYKMDLKEIFEYCLRKMIPENYVLTNINQMYSIQIKENYCTN